jgi:hypothetical protein
MELDLQSIFGLVFTHWPRPRHSPLSPLLGSYTRALLVSKDRRHLFFCNPWVPCSETYHPPVNIPVIVEVLPVAALDAQLPATAVLVAVRPQEGPVPVLQVILCTEAEFLNF